MLDNTPNQPSKFRARNWVEINSDSWGMYNVSNQIKFKTSVIRSNLCDYSDTHMHVKETITVRNTAVTDATANNANEKIIFKNCVLFTNCISKIINTQVDDAHDIVVVMPTYNLIEYKDIYLKTSGSLWQ